MTARKVLVNFWSIMVDRGDSKEGEVHVKKVKAMPTLMVAWEEC